MLFIFHNFSQYFTTLPSTSPFIMLHRADGADVLHAPRLVAIVTWAHLYSVLRLIQNLKNLKLEKKKKTNNQIFLIVAYFGLYKPDVISTGMGDAMLYTKL